MQANPAVARLKAYVPGEQPREPGFVKLNTNESPYPPAPAVRDAVRAAAEEALFNKYPDPSSARLRSLVAKDLGLDIDQILVGNGSDEVLRILCHVFLTSGSEDAVGMLYPSYTLYRTLAEMFGCGCREFRVSQPDYAISEEAFEAGVKLFFLPNPNPPIGTLYPLEQITRLAGVRPERLVVVDEAYADFSGQSAIGLLQAHPNLVITRTFSKSYSLAGLRVGFMIADPRVISEAAKVKDSYNVNRLSQAAAEAAWQAGDYYGSKNRVICEDREFLSGELRLRGFEVADSRGNFVFARRPDADSLYRRLKALKILVRYFDTPGLTDGVRITVGTRGELDALLAAIDEVSAES